LKVTILNSIPGTVESGSGTTVGVRNLVAVLRSADVDVEVLTPRPLALGVTATRWWFNRGLRAAAVAGSDVVLGVDGDGWKLPQRDGRAYIALLKGVYPEVMPFERGLTRFVLGVQARWERTAARAAAVVIVPSSYSARAVARHYGVPPDRIQVVPEPFDLAAWRRDLPSAFRRGNHVLCVAHLYPRKRIETLLAAWPAVLTERPDAELDIIGTGPQFGHLARRAGILQGCRMRGHVPLSELRAAYASADCFCLPSRQENFGIAAVEGLASGLPLVVAAAGALPETVAGAVAELVADDDPVALAAAVVASLEANVARRAARINPHVTRRYSPDEVGRRFLDAVAVAGVFAAPRR
jgi:glycosyltransferase involved in cell wall biosynthesis